MAGLRGRAGLGWFLQFRAWGSGAEGLLADMAMAHGRGVELLSDLVAVARATAEVGGRHGCSLVARTALGTAAWEGSGWWHAQHAPGAQHAAGVPRMVAQA